MPARLFNPLPFPPLLSQKCPARPPSTPSPPPPPPPGAALTRGPRARPTTIIPSPPTPNSYFSSAPAIISPDDIQPDGPPHPSSIAHLLSHPSLPSPKTDLSCLSEDDLSKVQVFLRNNDRWGSYGRLESSPPLPLLSQDNASTSDEFSWEATPSALMDANQLPDPSRCSLLIHEVSMLVGLTPDDEHFFPDDDDNCPLLPDASKQARDILPLSLNPTKSLASHKHRNADLPRPINLKVPVRSPDIHIPPHAGNVVPGLYNKEHPPAGSRDPPTPIPHYKRTRAARPSQSPRWRQGQVFFEPPFSSAPHWNLVDSDKMFLCPRDPPPKPIMNSPVNRCSSLDRLERSLLKLEAHAPGNHRKPQSEGRPSDRVVQKRGKRPSLPPPQHLKQQRSSHEINLSRPANGYHFSGRPPHVPKPTLFHQRVAPPICPSVPRNADPLERDPTPGSFMDMDIPRTDEARPTRRTSFRQTKSAETMKSLVSTAKRVSRGVITWGKNLTGSTKPPLAVQDARL